MYDVYANGESIYDPTNSSLYLFSPKVKLEFGKAGSFEFVIPPSNVYYDSLNQMKTVITVEDDAGVEIFRGRILNISRDFNNLKTVYCEGDLAYLVDSVQKGEKYEGTTHALFRKIIQKHNSMVESNKRFTVGNITIDDRPVKITGKSEESDNTGNIDYKQIALDSIADNWNSSYDCIQNWIIDYCGGYLQTRRVGSTTYIDLLNNHDNTIDAKVTFGVNMLDLTEEASIEDDDFFTVLIPLGDENLTIKTVNNNSEELINTDLVKRYGRIVRTHVFSNVSQPTTLLENAKRYMAFNKEPPITVTVKAIDMHFIDSNEATIYVGDYIKIVSKPHDISRRLVCTEIEYDLIDIENTAYTFGNPKQTLTQRYKEDKRKSNDANSAGSSGGGAAAAAGAANWKLKEASAKDTDDKLKRAYDAWFDIDETTGTGRFGGLYREFEGVKTVLERQVGIDFDAEEGNINLYSVTEKIDQLSGEQETARADFNALTTEVGGKLTALTEMQASYKTDTDTKIASINTWANEIESGISAKADKVDVTALQVALGGTSSVVDEMKNVLTKQVGIDFSVDKGNINLSTLNKKVNENGTLISKSSTAIDQISTSLQSQITLEAKHYSEMNGTVARIQMLANEQGSQINLKADKVTVSNDLEVLRGRLIAAEANIDKLNASTISADELAAKIATIQNLSVLNVKANSIVSPSISVTDGGGGTIPVASLNFVTSSINAIANGNELGRHYHEVIVNDTTGIITLGKPTSSPQSFNIRATKTYRDGVAAAASAATVTVDQISVSRNESTHPSGESYNTGTHNTTLYINATVTNSNGTTVTKPWSFVVSGANAYEAGLRKGAESSAAAIEEAVNNVEVTRITRTTSYDSSTHNTTITPTAYVSNGKTFTPETSWVISGANAYTAGRASVERITIERNPNSGYVNSEQYDSFTHKTTIFVKATAENNNIAVGYFTTGTQAFDNGRAIGLSEGTAAAENNLVVNKATGRFTTYDTTKNQYTVYLNASAKLGNTIKTNSEGTYTFAATASYNKGKDDGANSLSLDIPSITVSPEGWELSGGTYRYPLKATASASTKSSVTTITDSKTSTAWYYVYGTIPYNAGKTAAGPTKTTISVAANSFDSSTKTMQGTVTVTLGDKSTKSFSNVPISASQPWDAVSVSSASSISFDSSLSAIAIGNSSTSYEGDSNKYIAGCIQINLSNGKTTKRRIRIDASKAYTSGTNSVSISSVSAIKHDSSYTAVNIGQSSAVYEGDSNKVVAGAIKITLNNGKTLNRRVRINATQAYNSGVEKGRGEASVSVGSIYIQKVFIQYEYRYRYRAVCVVNGVTYYGDYEDL